MRLTGKELLEKIKSIHGIYDLSSYPGNLRDIAVECGYLEKENIEGRKTNAQKFKLFYHAYWTALQKNKDLQAFKPSKERYQSMRGKLIKKYQHIPTEAERLFKENEKVDKQRKVKERELYRKKNPLKRAGKLVAYVDETLKDDTFIKDEPIKKYKLNKHVYEKLSGYKLIDEVLKLRSIRKKEVSICIITGYEVSKIGVFRRAFAKAAGVKLAPLNRMIIEMREKEFLFEEKPEKIENIETIENSENKEIFINREKITSQVKRLYRNPKFREKVLSNHGSICFCCDISIEKLIEAAHIIPVEDNGNDEVYNGIPLCPTHHTAFDNFLFTINPENNLIIYKEGLGPKDIQITKTKCELKVSKQSLKYRYKLFKEE